jgi:hypothetical protein
MNFDGKITCEPGRTIARDNLPLFYINIARHSRATGGYNLEPWQADSIARQIAAAMRAGIIRVPAELADGAALDANPPGAALRQALLLIGAQHPVWNKGMESYDALVNGWLASARAAVGAEGADDDAKADWCSREAERGRRRAAP